LSPGFDTFGKIKDDVEEDLTDVVSLFRSHKSLVLRVERLEKQMGDLTTAEADLANVVQGVVTNTAALNTQVASLQAAIAAGDDAAVSAAADAIEAQVQILQGTLPAPAPAPVTPPSS
jgi:hypothetical protein